MIVNELSEEPELEPLVTLTKTFPDGIFGIFHKNCLSLPGIPLVIKIQDAPLSRL